MPNGDHRRVVAVEAHESLLVRRTVRYGEFGIVAYEWRAVVSGGALCDLGCAEWEQALQDEQWAIRNQSAALLGAGVACSALATDSPDRSPAFVEAKVGDLLRGPHGRGCPDIEATVAETLAGSSATVGSSV
jgi:hypothetical protein